MSTVLIFFGMRSCKACNFGSDKIIRGKVIEIE